MFLLDHAPQAAQRLQQARHASHTVSSMIYEVYLKPRSENEAVYSALSAQIQNHRRTRSLEERTLMHLYAASLVFGDGTPPKGMDPQLIGKIDAMVLVERFHYRHKHPIAARLLKAA